MIASRLSPVVVVALLISACSSVAQAAPTVSPTLDVSDITTMTATISGSVSSSLALSYHFEYGTTTSYGSSAPTPEVEKDPFVCNVTSAAQTAQPDFDPPWLQCSGAETAYDRVSVSLYPLQPGTTYHARLVAHDTDGASYGNDTAFTTAPGPPPVDVTSPTLSGRAIVGGTLTCDPGRWNGAATFAFAWLRDDVAIPAATANTYGPGAADAGAQIACQVTASSPGDLDGVEQTDAVGIGHEPLHVALLTRTAVVGRAGTTHLRVSCENVFERCRTLLTLNVAKRRGRGTTLARATVVLAPGTSGRLTLALNRTGRRLLAAAPHHRLSVKATLGGATHTLLLTS